MVQCLAASQNHHGENDRILTVADNIAPRLLIGRDSPTGKSAALVTATVGCDARDLQSGDAFGLETMVGCPWPTARRWRLAGCRSFHNVGCRGEAGYRGRYQRVSCALRPESRVALAISARERHRSQRRLVCIDAGAESSRLRQTGSNEAMYEIAVAIFAAADRHDRPDALRVRC